MVLLFDYIIHSIIDLVYNNRKVCRIVLSPVTRQ